MSDAEQSGEKHDDAVDVDVGDLVARVLGVDFGACEAGRVLPSGPCPCRGRSVCMFRLQHLFQVRIVHVHQRTLHQLRQVVGAPQRQHRDRHRDVGQNAQRFARCRLPAASLKFGSISQNISTQRAKSIQQVSQIIFCLLRFRSRDSSRQNGISQWQMKSSEQMVHQPP